MFKKKIACFIAVMVAMTISLGIANAEDVTADSKAALAVYKDDQLMKEFSVSELEAIAKNEGSKKYSFSAFNTYANDEGYISYKGSSGETGPTIEGILKAAGIEPSTIKADQQMLLTASDTMKFMFTKEQLLGTRYYYPNAKSEAGPYGSVLSEKAYEGKVIVPALYSMDASEPEAKVMFGQKYPNEQNYSAFVGYMLSTDQSKYTSKITVLSDDADQWNAISSATNVKNGAKVAIGKKILLSSKEYPVDHSKGYTQCWVHYTTDGTEPDATSSFYNYSRFNGLNNPPVVSKLGENTFKFLVVGYGKTDSEITTLTYIGVPTTPAIKSATAGKKKITVKWNVSESADGYKVYRATKASGKYTAVKTIKNPSAKSYTNTGLKKGKKYFYKVKAFAKKDGKTYESAFSKVKSAKSK